MDSPFPFTPEIMEKIEAEMRKICKEKLKLERFELPRAEAIKFMEEKNEPYKVELINDLPEDSVISFYRQGEFTDLCAGPHLDSTGRIKGNAIKLTACNAAYWRGDSSRQTLQRIYGIAFPKKDELDEYLARIEEAKRRDHRKLGRELGLFAFRDEAPGFPFYLPKGMVLKNTLIDYWREVHKKWEYVEIQTPQIMRRTLWETSGHWDHYKDEVYSLFGLPYKIELSTMPEDHIGSVEDWDIATSALADAITSIGKEYTVNPGDGAFYGPKLDFHIQDSLGRTWQCGTIQLDYQLPGRFDLEYTGADGEKHCPVMIHRVVFGSIERFIGIITEHFAGAFPVWLSPVQVKVMPITDRTSDYAKDVAAKLSAAGVRVETDLRNEKIGYKIREAQMQKTPYMLVIGDREAESGAVAVRTRGGEDLGAMPLDAFIERITGEIKSRSNG